MDSSLFEFLDLAAISQKIYKVLKITKIDLSGAERAQELGHSWCRLVKLLCDLDGKPGHGVWISYPFCEKPILQDFPAYLISNFQEDIPIHRKLLNECEQCAGEIFLPGLEALPKTFFIQSGNVCPEANFERLFALFLTPCAAWLLFPHH